MVPIHQEGVLCRSFKYDGVYWRSMSWFWSLFDGRSRIGNWYA